MRTITYRGFEISIYPQDVGGVMAKVRPAREPAGPGLAEASTSLHSEVFELKYIAARGCRDERTQFRTSREAARLAIGRCRVWINNRSTLQQGINQAVDQAVHDGEVAEYPGVRNERL